MRSYRDIDGHQESRQFRQKEVEHQTEECLCRVCGALQSTGQFSFNPQKEINYLLDLRQKRAS